MRIDLEHGRPGEVEIAADTLVVVWCERHDRLPPLVGTRRVVLIAPRERKIPGVEQLEWLARHSAWTPTVIARLRRHRIDAALVHSLESAGPLAIALAWLAGARRIHFTHAGGAALGGSPLAAVLLTLWSVLRRFAARRSTGGALFRRLLGPRLAAPLTSVHGARRAMTHAARHANARPPTAQREPDSGSRASHAVIHYVGALGPGGAERQLTYLASGARARGHRVAVVTSAAPDERTEHFRAELESAGVPVTWAAADWSRDRIVRWLDGAEPGPSPALRATLAQHPAWAALVPLVALLARERPETLHAWLDDANVIGATAALAAGVSRIVASTRSLSPAHYPRFAKRWHRPGYRLLAHVPGARLVANSHAGAADYARWAGLRSDRFVVIPNGVPVERFWPLSAEQRRARRAELGFTPDAFLVVGVLRCSVEKRPHDFVRAIGAARACGAPVRGIHIGSGPDAAAVRAFADELGLGDAIAFLGALPDPERYLAIADVTLLPSEFEGCPNVPLEAQALGVPAIVTCGGGSPEVVREGETGFVCGVGDTDAMGALIAELAHDRARVRALGERGRAWVVEHFSMEAMVDASLALYGLHSPAS